MKNEKVSKFLESAKSPVKMNSIEILALHLYFETQNWDSALRSYFQSMPIIYENAPYTWKDEKILQLPSNIAIHVLAAKRRLLSITQKLDLDYEKFLWTFTSVFTRTFSGSEIPLEIPNWFLESKKGIYPFMAPLIDLINHSHEPNMSWNGAGDGVDDMILEAKRDLKKGEELFISYIKKKSDDDLFICHGFCDPPGSNSNTTVLFTLQDIVESLSNLPKINKWEKLKRSQKKNMDYFISLDEISDDLIFDLAFLSGTKTQHVYMCLEDSEFAKHNQFFENFKICLRRKEESLLNELREDLKGNEVRRCHLFIVQLYLKKL